MEQASEPPGMQPGVTWPSWGPLPLLCPFNGQELIAHLVQALCLVEDTGRGEQASLPHRGKLCVTAEWVRLQGRKGKPREREQCVQSPTKERTWLLGELKDQDPWNSGIISSKDWVSKTIAHSYNKLLAIKLEKKVKQNK